MSLKAQKIKKQGTTVYIVSVLKPLTSRALISFWSITKWNNLYSNSNCSCPCNHGEKPSNCAY